jgi:hypothetical protein
MLFHKVEFMQITAIFTLLQRGVNGFEFATHDPAHYKII